MTEYHCSHRPPLVEWLPLHKSSCACFFALGSTIALIKWHFCSVSVNPGSLFITMLKSVQKSLYLMMSPSKVRTKWEDSTLGRMELHILTGCLAYLPQKCLPTPLPLPPWLALQVLVARHQQLCPTAQDILRCCPLFESALDSFGCCWLHHGKLIPQGFLSTVDLLWFAWPWGQRCKHRTWDPIHQVGQQTVMLNLVGFHGYFFLLELLSLGQRTTDSFTIIFIV